MSRFSPSSIELKPEVKKSEEPPSGFQLCGKVEDEKLTNWTVKTETIMPDMKSETMKEETKDSVKLEMRIDDVDTDLKVNTAPKMEVKDEKTTTVIESERGELTPSHRDGSLAEDSSEDHSTYPTPATPEPDVSATPDAEELVLPTPAAPARKAPQTARTAPVVHIKAEPIDIDIESASNSAELARPEKRRRIFMDGVVVPSIASVRSRAEAERQEIHRKLEQLRNPIVKKPKNVPTLSLDTVRARLESIGYEPYPIDLEKDILDVTVRRDFMAEEYGGNAQMTYPKIGDAFVAKTGMKYFMYLNLLYNPHCPEVPGAPGLLFDADFPSDSDDSESDDSESDDSDDEDENKYKISNKNGDEGEEEGDGDKGKKKEEDPTRILFSRLDSATWQYQGQYVLAPAPPLTLNEWKQQSPQVRKTWAKQLSIKSWGRSIRADIVLRRQLGRKPTKRETKTALKSDNKFKTVTPEEISSAFNRGEVIIVVSTLECVGYNTNFQRDLAAKMPFFVPKPRKQVTKKPGSKRKGKKAAPAKRGAAPVSRGQKRKREEVDEEDDSDVGPESEEEQDRREIIYRPQGTRSRLIHVAP
ncbi:hypothetical protein DFH09DRAFT_1146900 [Mycena vulgaris]|nr:hypothetical protein DFH09DRAFT_1146900 [Mycena vulgaris]